MYQPGVAAALAALLASLPYVQGMYSKNSPVLQLDAKNYNSLITRSNHTSIVEFYAPWCGHCKNLKRAYETVAQKMEGLAKVAAIDCDEEKNKQFCGAMGVQGFPTLKIVRPGKMSSGKPVVEDYQGPRTASGIMEAVKSKINNHVTRVVDKDLKTFLTGDKPKALLFTDKGTTSALLRSLAIDFLGVISFGQIRDKEKGAVEKFGVKRFPSFVLVPGEDKEPIVHSGELNKKAMVEFLRQVGEPNPDPAPAKAKAKAEKKPQDSKKAKKAKDQKTTSDIDDEPKVSTKPSDESPSPGTAATPTPDLVAIPSITTKTELTEKCLVSKASTCVLAFTPSGASDEGDQAKASLSQIHSKYVHGHRQIFPFLAVSNDIDGVAALKKSLDLKADVELVAINARRAWSRHYEGDFSAKSVEAWIDAIRMGEGAKKKLPADVIVDVDAEGEATSSKPSEAPAEETVAEEVKHEEL